MPSTFTTNTGIEKIASGEQTGTWGDTTNTNFDIIDRALNGSTTISLSGTTHTLTTSSGATSDGQFAVIVFGGSPSGTNTVTISPDTAQKLYAVRNTTVQTVVMAQGSGATVSIPAGTSKIVYSNGAGATAAVFDLTNTFAMGAAVITGGTIDGVAIGGTTPASVANVDNLRLDGNTLSSTDANGNIVLAPNGTGGVLTDNLRLDGNTISSTDTDGDINLAPNGTGSVTAPTPAQGDNSTKVATTAYALTAVAGAARGYIFGLTLANNATDANNDIDIAAGTAASDDASPVLMTLSSTLTKRLDAAWVVGTGNGGLDTGSKANSTWYYVWLIRRPDTGVVDALFSASSSAPTMPANYTQKRLIGFVLTNGSGNIRAFVHFGNDYVWSELLSAQVTLSTTDLTTISLAVPPIGKGVRAYISGNAQNPSGGFSMWLGDGSGVNVAAGIGTGNRVDVADIASGSYGYFSKSLISSSAASFSVRTNFAGVVLTYSTNSFTIDRRLL